MSLSRDRLPRPTLLGLAAPRLVEVNRAAIKINPWPASADALQGQAVDGSHVGRSGPADRIPPCRRNLVLGSEGARTGDDDLYLTATFLKHGGLSLAPWSARVSRSLLAPIEEEIRNLIDDMEVPTELVVQHPRISPTAMTRLLRAFGTMPGRPEELLPVNPADDDAAKRYSGFSI